MSQHGSGYKLILRCDHRDEEYGPRCRHSYVEFLGKDRGDAVSKARAAGWYLAEHMGNGEDYCPEHRMAEHWRPAVSTGSEQEGTGS